MPWALSCSSMYSLQGVYYGFVLGMHNLSINKGKRAFYPNLTTLPCDFKVAWMLPWGAVLYLQFCITSFLEPPKLQLTRLLERWYSNKHDFDNILVRTHVKVVYKMHSLHMYLTYFILLIVMGLGVSSNGQTRQSKITVSLRWGGTRPIFRPPWSTATTCNTVIICWLELHYEDRSLS